MVIKMVKEFYTFLIILFIKVSLKTINFMDKVYLKVPTFLMKENGNIILNMVSEYTNLKMVIPI